LVITLWAEPTSLFWVALLVIPLPPELVAGEAVAGQVVPRLAQAGEIVVER